MLTDTEIAARDGGFLGGTETGMINPIYTRAEYMADSTLPGAYRRYYGGIVEACGLESFRLPRPVAVIRAALAAGDEYLNTIPLGEWDLGYLPPAASTALRERGDFPSLGTKVCILKTAARMLAEKET